MARSAISLFLLFAVLAGCASDPPEDTRRSDEPKRTTERTTGPSANPAETIAETSGATGGATGAPEYIVISESEREEAGVRTAQVIVTAKKTSDPELRRIVEDLKGKYRGSDVALVEIMDGAAGFGKAGSAVIMYTDEGARSSGYPEGIPNDRGYVLNTVD